MRRILVAFSLVSSAVLFGVSSPSIGEPQDCRVAYDSGLLAASYETAEGYYSYQAWVANPDAQAAVQRLDHALDARFGSSGKTVAEDPLARGLVGVALDHISESIAVVVDPSLVDTLALETALETAAEGADGITPFPLKVTDGCFSAKDLLDARDVLRSRDWHPRAGVASFGFFLDPHDSTFHVTFAPSDQDVADALKEVLGAKATVDFGMPSRVGRLDDGEPHWGGAGIGRPKNNNFCTSGFTVVLASGNLGSISAGHCFDNGQKVHSGPEYYGETHGKSNYPTYDMIRIHPDGETFDNKIHVDPCCPTVRTLISAGDPAVGAYVCQSGMTTRAVCGIEVVSVTAESCDIDGCTPDLMKGRKPGETITQGGDSGGPVYVREGDTQARARTMIIARTQPSNVFAEKWSNIRGHLDVNIAT